MRLSSQGASEMKSLIERQELELIALRARVAELEEALHAWNSACHIDPMMEGPRFRGVSPIMAQKAYDKTCAALTKTGESK